MAAFLSLNSDYLMRRLASTIGTVAVLSVSATVAAAQTSADIARLAPAARRITAAALADSGPHRRLAALVDGFGHRLSGSPALEQAIDWVLAEMQRDGFANVRGEPVMVPHWVRGAESAMLVSPREAPLHMLGLGGSVGTGAEGITAEVMVVHSFDELERRKAEAPGKIVLFNTPFPKDSAPFAGYDVAVQYRGRGATAAAKAGAVAMLLRSVATFSMQTPHTGGLRYDPAVTKIPAAALSIEDAEMLDRMQARGATVRVTLTMRAQMLPDAPSRNAVAELRGRELPDEVVVIGGHIDSWDVGQGAMDDAGGSVAAWEAVKLLKRLGITPRRTIRVVLWTNEENGGRGGAGYRDAHKAELGKHFAAIESDNGIFAPRGFRFQGTAAASKRAALLAQLTRIAGAPAIAPGEGEADVGPILAEGVPGFALDVDASKYFWYHHTAADMLNAVSDADLRRCVAAMAILAYSLAEMPGTLR